MGSISKSVRTHGGIAATHELLADGHTPSGIFAAVRSGDIIRVRKGWYANSHLDDDVLRAWRVGGQLACVSAARHHRLWVPETSDQLHISVSPVATQLRRPTDAKKRLSEIAADDVHIHWNRSSSSKRTAVSIPIAISQIFACQPMDVGFVVFESALNQGRLETIDRIDIFEGLSIKARKLVRLADNRSDSGTESLVKLVLLRLWIPFRQQVLIDGIGRVDFLVGDRLVIEVDSKEHHGDAYRDRKRDALLSIAGYRVLRFMYSQIVYEPDLVRAAILGALARADHNRA